MTKSEVSLVSGPEHDHKAEQILSVTVTVPNEDGLPEKRRQGLKVFSTDVLGLFIGPAVRAKGEYDELNPTFETGFVTVYHHGGRPVVGARMAPKVAKEFVAALRDLTDWTRPEGEIASDAAVRAGLSAAWSRACSAAGVGLLDGVEFYSAPSCDELAGGGQ